MIRRTVAVLALLLAAACGPETAADPVSPGAFCSPPGAEGHTAAGKPMVCGPSATDTRNRWRAS